MKILYFSDHGPYSNTFIRQDVEIISKNYETLYICFEEHKEYQNKSIKTKIVKYPSNSFKSKIYYLSQKNFILNDTLTNNVAFAAYKIDQDRLDEAIRLSGLEIFRLKQKNNIDEQLGEDASKISGGESQRIALARAIYANKEILILDEFTISLDKENENKIFEVTMNDT